MRKISRWARTHAVSARIIIIVSHFLLVAIAFTLSEQAIPQSIRFSQCWFYIFIVGSLVAALYYPRGNAGNKSKWNYAKRKTFDLLVVLFGFCLYFLVASELNQPTTGSWSASALTIEKSPYKNPEAERLLKSFREGQRHTFTKQEKRILRQEFNYQLEQYVKAKITGDKAKQDTTLPIILCCVAAVGLLFLVASLACLLDCGGSATGALLVGVLGTAAVIFGLVMAIKAINRKAQKKMTADQ